MSNLFMDFSYPSTEEFLFNTKKISPRKQIILCIVILGMVSLLQYAYSLGNDFVWDSEAVFLKDVSTRDFKYFPSYFTESFSKHIVKETGQMKALMYYRPLVKILHFFEYKAFGTKPLGYNAINVVLNIIVVIVAFLFVRSITDNQRVAFIASLFFAVNPSHVEAVSWAYSDSYLLSSLFVLLSLYLFHRKRLGLSLLLFGLSLLSKETSVLMPVALVLYVYLVRGEKSLKGYFVLIPYFALVGLYLAIRTAAVGPTPVSDTDIIPLINTVAVILKTCVKIFFLPDALVTIYHYREGMFSEIGADTIFSYAILIGIFGLGIFLWFRNKKYLFWYLWFFVWIAVILNVGKYGEYYMADKILYLASLGFCVLIAQFAVELPVKKSIVYPVIAGFIIVHSAVTFARTLYWKDNITYLEKAVEFESDFYMIHYLLGNNYRARGEFERAFAEYEETLRLVPTHSYAHNNLGNIYYLKNDFDGALQSWQTAARFDPSNPQPYYNIAMVLEKRGEVGKSLEYYRKYLSLTPRPSPSILRQVSELERNRISTGQEDALDSIDSVGQKSGNE